MKGYMEQGMIENSGRITNRLLNTLLHRQTDLDDIRLRTMTDMVEREGTAYCEYQVSHANQVLTGHGWNADTLLPLPGTIPNPRYGVDPGDTTGFHAQIADLIADVNSRRDADARIPSEAAAPYEAEQDSSRVVMVSFDGVSSKRQKDHRVPRKKNEGNPFTHDTNDGPADYSRAPDPRKRPKVETAVAHIEADGLKYVFAGRNMFETFRFVLAFLLESNLLVDRKLVFFTDGGKDIKACIERIFAFCPFTVVLDWFHLKKYCCELLSMALTGGKANRDMQYTVKRRLFHILWAGNVESAKLYLESLDKKWIKSETYLQELIKYLDRKSYCIACYVVRQKLGLRISSNKVEKANDMLVSSRQKGDSMSWSREGSWALANVTAMYLNHEDEAFHTVHKLAYQMYRNYGNVFDLKLTA